MALGGWIAARIALLWPVALIPASAARVATPPIAGDTIAATALSHGTPVERTAIASWPMARVMTPARPRRWRDPPGRATGAADVEDPGIAHAPVQREAAATGTRGDYGVIAAPLRPTPTSRTRSRLAGSAWLIARGGGNSVPAPSPLGGQLGGSQAGARLTYALGEGRRVALSARIATPLHGSGREAAFGLDWQPMRMPLHLIAEQRVSLDGGRGGPTLLLVGGLNPTPLVAGFRLEGYGQAGAIKRDGVEAFGDGAIRLSREVAVVGRARIDLGAGGWGAVQRGARRFDIGPTVGAVVPVAHAAVRLTLDWRERIAGDARPGSGPALSIGTDF